jgi:dTDP-4-amino-4,6-dideoxy-D-galactose acyltransferase
MKIVELEWDSDFFGYPIGKLTDFQGALQIDEVWSTLGESGLRVVYIESESDQPQLESAHIVDQITLQMQVGNGHVDDPAREFPIAIYPCVQPTDELVELAIQAGWSSRFRVDRQFGESEFIRLYKIWIVRSCLREIADTVLVVKESDRCCGFVTGTRNESDFKIGLIAVSNAYRKRGIGRRLLAASELHASELGCTTVSVVTQAINHAALRLYESFGFRKKSTLHWYHIWNGGRQN